MDWLVVEPTPLKNMKFNEKDDIPYMTWKIKKKCLKPPTSVLFFLKYVSIFMPAPISRKDLSLKPAAARSPCYWLNLRCPPWCQRRHTRHRRPGFSGGRRRGPFRYHLAVKCRTWFTHIPPEYKIRAVLKDLAWNKRYNVCFNRISECRPRLFEKTSTSVFA